jgi:hypothetical protein
MFLSSDRTGSLLRVWVGIVLLRLGLQYLLLPSVVPRSLLSVFLRYGDSCDTGIDNNRVFCAQPLVKLINISTLKASLGRVPKAILVGKKVRADKSKQCPNV